MEAVDIIEKLSEQLTRRGKKPRHEVRTTAGVADIVTDMTVYEAVGELTSAETLRAVKKLAAIRQALDPKLRAIVVGQRSGQIDDDVLEEARQLDVSIMFWGEQA